MQFGFAECRVGTDGVPTRYQRGHITKYAEERPRSGNEGGTAEVEITELLSLCWG